MSEQADGHLQLPSSFNFKRDTTSDYKRKSIDFNRFQEWHKGDMYASTYCKNHSPVQLPSFRNHKALEMHIFRVMEDIFQKSELKVWNQKAMQIPQGMYLIGLRSI